MLPNAREWKKIATQPCGQRPHYEGIRGKLFQLPSRSEEFTTFVTTDSENERQKNDEKYIENNRSTGAEFVEAFCGGKGGIERFVLSCQSLSSSFHVIVFHRDDISFLFISFSFSLPFPFCLCF